MKASGLGRVADAADIYLFNKLLTIAADWRNISPERDGESRGYVLKSVPVALCALASLFAECSLSGIRLKSKGRRQDAF
jgi:hypothetical protein